MFCMLWLFSGTGNLKELYSYIRSLRACVQVGLLPTPVGACNVPGGRLFHPAAFAFGSPVPPSQYICHDLLSPECDGDVCSLLVWIDRFLIGMVQQKQSRKGSRSRMLHLNICLKEPIMTDIWKGRSRSCFLSSFSCWWFSSLPTTGLWSLSLYSCMAFSNGRCIKQLHNQLGLAYAPPAAWAESCKPVMLDALAWSSS